jgi:hypothetical protein
MLSVLADQRISTCVADLAAARVMAGELGGWVSDVVPPLTLTVTEAVVLPAAFDAVSRYVVVWSGETDREVTEDTFPTPLSIASAVAPDTVHERVAVCPLLMTSGLALKEAIEGTAAGEEFDHESETIGILDRS